MSHAPARTIMESKWCGPAVPDRREPGAGPSGRPYFRSSIRSLSGSHSRVVSIPVWLERLPRFAEALHRVDVDALGCGRHVAQGHVVEHALAQGRDLFGHRDLLSLRIACPAILSDRRSRANGI